MGWAHLIVSKRAFLVMDGSDFNMWKGFDDKYNENSKLYRFRWFKLKFCHIVQCDRKFFLKNAKTSEKWDIFEICCAIFVIFKLVLPKL